MMKRYLIATLFALTTVFALTSSQARAQVEGHSGDESKPDDDDDPDDPNDKQYVVSPYYSLIPPSEYPKYLEACVERLKEWCESWGGQSTLSVHYSSVSNWQIYGDCTGLSPAAHNSFWQKLAPQVYEDVKDEFVANAK